MKPAADREVSFATAQGAPVFTSEAALLAWVADREAGE